MSVAYVAVAAAMLGHCLPMFADFKGGKAVMTFPGGAFALSPAPAFICLVACLLVWFVTRELRWAARVGLFGFPSCSSCSIPSGRSSRPAR